MLSLPVFGNVSLIAEFLGLVFGLVFFGGVGGRRGQFLFFFPLTVLHKLLHRKKYGIT